MFQKFLAVAAVLVASCTMSFAQFGGPPAGQIYPAGFDHLYDPDGNYVTVTIGVGSSEAPLGIALSVPGDLDHPFEVPFCPVTATQTDPFTVDWSEYTGVTLLNQTGADYSYPPADPAPDPRYDTMSSIFENSWISATSDMVTAFSTIDTNTMLQIDATNVALGSVADFLDDLDTAPSTPMSTFVGGPMVCDYSNPQLDPLPPYFGPGPTGPTATEHVNYIFSAFPALIEWICNGGLFFTSQAALTPPDWSGLPVEYHNAFKAYDMKLRAINHNSWRIQNDTTATAVSPDDFVEYQEWLIDQAQLEFYLDIVDAVADQYP